MSEVTRDSWIGSEAIDALRLLVGERLLRIERWHFVWEGAEDETEGKLCLGHPCQNSPVARWPVSAEDRAPRRSHTYGYAPSSTTADSVSLAPLDTSLSQRARSEF